jgi:ketosteroid isomerase-like protein
VRTPRRRRRGAISGGSVVALALVAVLAGSVGCSGGAKCPKGATLTGEFADAEVADVLRAIEQWRVASEERSVNALFALYDQTPSVSLVTQGAAIVGWEAVQAELTARFAAATAIHYKVTDIRVSPIGGGAVATAALAREISDGVKTVNDLGTLTLAFGKSAEGAWVIVAEHFSFRPM